MPPEAACLSEAQVCGAHFSLESRGFLKDQVESALHTPGPSHPAPKAGPCHFLLQFSISFIYSPSVFSKTHLKCLPRCWSNPTLSRKTKGQLPCSSILPTVVILSWFSGGCKSALCARYKLSYLHTWIYSSITVISKIHVVTVSHYDTVKINLPNMLQGGSYSLTLYILTGKCL